MIQSEKMCLSKVRYSAKIDAALAAIKFGPKAQRNLYFYKCPRCKGFHLTKKAR